MKKKKLKLKDVKQNLFNYTFSYDKINIFYNENVKNLNVSNIIMKLTNSTDTWNTNLLIPDAGQTGWTGYYPEAHLYPATSSKAGSIVLIDKKRKNMYFYFFLFVIILFFLNKRN